MDPSQIELSFSQKFEQERFMRVLDETENVEELRAISKQLLQAWFAQKAATDWAIRQTFKPEQINFTINSENPPE